MDNQTKPKDSRPSQPPFVGVGARLTTWIIVVFVITLIVFVGLDIRHEARFAESLGASQDERAALLADTLTLHAVHASVTALAFGLAIHLLVRRLVSRRIARIVLAIQHFRLGIWQVRIPTRVRDEIEWLTEALRQLGPDLECKLATFVEVDRKSVVALLGSRYEQHVAPPTRQIIAAAREGMRSGGSDRTWRVIEDQAMRILAELGKLGRPDHPMTADVVNLDSTDKIVSNSDARPISWSTEV